MTCVVNPWSGREGEMRLVRAASSKKVMVIGAGPAGMEAARVAAQRGHRVTLFEKASKTGGLFNLAAVPPHKQELTRVTRYLTAQLVKAGVELRLDTEVTGYFDADMLAEWKLLGCRGLVDLKAIDLSASFLNTGLLQTLDTDAEFQLNGASIGRPLGISR